MVSKIKSAIDIDAGTRIIYDKIKHKCNTNVYNYQIFSLALAFGYNRGVRIQLSKKDRYIRLSSINRDLDSLIWLIAIDEFGEKLDFENNVEIYEVAEEYANAGIMIIEDYLSDEFDFNKFLEKTLFELFNKNDLLGILKDFGGL